MIDKTVLDSCVAFHGHVCPGLLIGIRAALAARERFGVERSVDEELVVIAENRSCGVDALQVILGATAGKGNLFFKDYGKQVVTVGSRGSGKAVRVSLKRNGGLTREEKVERLMNASDEELFDILETTIDFPAKAKVFKSVPCERCGEGTMEIALRLLKGRKLCEPCFDEELGEEDFSSPSG